MHNRHLRRVNFSLHLAPEHSRADLHALQQLKRWRDALPQATRDVGEVNRQIRHFHRRVYLAGLQLQLLKPALCSHIAESLGRESLTLDVLCAELRRDGLLPDEAAQSGFSDPQLAQMRDLMSRIAAPVAEPATSADAGELAALREEVAGLRVLLQQQTRLLEQLHVGQPRSARSAEKVPEEQDAAAAPLEKLKKIRQKGIF